MDKDFWADNYYNHNNMSNNEEGYCRNCGTLIMEEDEHWCPFLPDDQDDELDFDTDDEMKDDD